MKISYVIMDGLEQFVLTPESDVERKLIDVLAPMSLRSGPYGEELYAPSRDVSIHRGSFYNCNGGWYRQGNDDSSAIICLRPKQADKTASVDTDGELAE